MKLSPCKHCGAIAHYAKSVTDPHLCWSIQCSDCGISTPSYSQQEMAASAWNRTAVAPKYDHRNGEIGPPTKEGRYWFKGNLDARYVDTQYFLTVVDSADGLLAWHKYYSSYKDISTFDGYWWGPIVAPWESPE